MNVHHPVLLNEVINMLACAPGRTVVDGTVGAGGHAKKILEALQPGGRLIGIDRDPEQLRRAQELFRDVRSGVMLVHDSYEHLPEVLRRLHVLHVDGVLLDLGVARQQLDDTTRGIGIHPEARLDLRFNPEDDRPTAAALLATASFEKLEDIFRRFGEIERPKALARAVIRAREQHPIETITDLEHVATPIMGHRRTHHPLTLVLQALRIAVNDELGALQRLLPQLLDFLSPTGRIVILTYHSLEDRIVKQFFVQESKACLCPPEIPVCRCDHHQRLQIINKKPIIPTIEEIQQFPTARSAKLRAAQRWTISPI